MWYPAVNVKSIQLKNFISIAVDGISATKPPVDVSKNISKSELIGSVSKTHKPADTALPDWSKVVTLASPDGFFIDCTEVKLAWGFTTPASGLYTFAPFKYLG